eukprot:Skav225156  [mRNA]  locus=scaffold1056:306089:308848:- [translate_table: standard]
MEQGAELDPQVRKLVEDLQLEPLQPEGGFFRRTHYSNTKVEGPQGEGQALSAILYLMLSENASKIHRLKVDESWHFYHGSPVTIVELDASVHGHARTTVESGLCPQYTVKAGTWFGAGRLHVWSRLRVRTFRDGGCANAAGPLPTSRGAHSTAIIGSCRFMLRQICRDSF